MIRGNKYFVTFIDDYTKKLWTYLIKKKNNVIDVFTKFKAMVERQCGHKIKTLGTDGGGEYVSNFLTYYVKEKELCMTWCHRTLLNKMVLLQERKKSL